MKNKKNIFRAIKRLIAAWQIKRYEKRFNGKPLNTVQSDIQKIIRQRRNIYFRDENTAQQLADNWDGIAQKPNNLRFIENAIPVVMCVDENFAPYMAVMLQSLLVNSNPQRKYHFMIFGRKLSDKIQIYLIEQTAKFQHCTIDFIDVRPMLDGIPLVAVNHVSIDAFSRLFIPYWLNKYEKVIYLDSDMIAKTDIAKLYDLNIEPFCVGISIGGEASQCVEKRKYGYFMKRSSVFMLLENWPRYINSGVLLFDTKKFAEKYPYRDAFRFAIYFTNRYAKRLNDQDVLALLVKDDYFVLPPEWNYSWSIRTEKGKYLPAPSGTKIVHFTGRLKPWKNSPLIDNHIDTKEYRKFALTVPLFRDTVSTSLRCR